MRRGNQHVILGASIRGSLNNNMAVYLVLGTWEQLGIPVFRDEISIDLVDDAFSGPIIPSWTKPGKFVEGFRARMNRETGFEWFQWLAERMLEREPHGAAVPAYTAHRNWRAKSK